MLDSEPNVPISPTLASMARRFDIDLASIADGVLRDHIVHEAMAGLTARMESAMVAAKMLARQYGHSHVGCEHVFLAILLDADSIPSQFTRKAGAIGIVEDIAALLKSEQYNRPVE